MGYTVDSRIPTQLSPESDPLLGIRWPTGLFILVIIFFAVGVKAGEVVRVGVYQNPPKVIIAPNGHVTGIFPEILEVIARQNDWDVKYNPGTWEQCLDRLEHDNLDLMVDMAVSDDGRQLYDFSHEPVLINWGTAYSQRDLVINSFLDFEDQSVAVMRGSIHTDGGQGIKKLIDKFGVSCRYIEVAEYEDVLMLLDSKQADVGIVNRLFGTLHADDYEIASTPIIFNPLKITFATRKGFERGNRFIGIIDKHLVEDKRKNTSSYQQILGYYLGGGTRDWRDQDQDYVNQVDFTDSEIQWLREHPILRFSVDPGFAPFEFLNSKGEFDGMAADFLHLVAQKTGIEFQFVNHEVWAESLDALENKRIDLLPCIGFSETRQRFIAYSQPYLKFSRVLVTQMECGNTNMASLSDMRVAIQAGSSHDAFLNEKSDVTPIRYSTFEECLLAVSSGDADVTIGNLAVTTYLIQNMTLTNVKISGYADPEPQTLAFGVRKDWPELAGIIDKVIDSISLYQRHEILEEWLPLSREAHSSIDLNQAEREWLLMHPRITVAWDHSWAPIEFADPKGNPMGISMEYLDALEHLLGIQFDMSQCKDWQSGYEMLQRREIDMSSCLAITSERLSHLDFTDTYLSSPVVIFARKEMPYIGHMRELRGLRVAVVKDYATDEWVSRNHSELDIVRVQNMSEGFHQLNKREIDAFIGSVLPGNFYISKHRMRNVKIAGETPYTYKLRMAVRNDWPIFAGVLKKALATLPEADRTAFYRKWVWVKYEHGFDYPLFIKILLGILAVVLVFVYWNLRLSREVKHRKQIQAELAKSEEALRVSYDELKKLEELKDSLTHMIVHDLRSPLTTITGALELMEQTSDKMDIEDIHLAKAGAQSALTLAQAILDIARLETGKMPLKLAEVDIKVITEQAVQDMEIQAKIAGVKVLVLGVAAICNGDKDILHRVIINLIGNAIKASIPGSTVEITTMISASEVSVKVKDTGYGVPVEIQDMLFEKFTSVEVGKKRKNGSVGLGLAFCKLAIEAHGGKITVESEEGKGSIFKFLLPGI